MVGRFIAVIKGSSEYLHNEGQHHAGTFGGQRKDFAHVVAEQRGVRPSAGGAAGAPGGAYVLRNGQREGPLRTKVLIAIILEKHPIFPCYNYESLIKKPGSLRFRSNGTHAPGNGTRGLDARRRRISIKKPPTQLRAVLIFIIKKANAFPSFSKN